MSRTGLRTTLGFLLIFAGVGCSSSSTGTSSSSGSAGSSSGSTTGSSGTSGSTSGLERLCGDFGDALCTIEPRCQIGEVPSDCKALFTQECVASTQQALSDGRQTLRDVGQYEQFCSSAALAQLPCVPGADFYVALFCSQITQGNVTVGGACHVAGDCKALPDGGDVTCVSAADTCGGLCKSGAALGEPCGSVGDSYLDCNDGYCPYTPPLPDGGKVQSVCVAYAAVGQPCGNAAECDAASFCDYTAPQPTCAAKQGAGAACQGDSCQDDLYCASPDGGFGNGSCHPRAATGEACDPGALSSCVDNDRCVAGLARCAPQDGDVGSPCHVGTTSCHSQTACVGETADHLGTCQKVDAGPPLGLGSPCSGPDGDEASCGGSSGFSGDYRCEAGVCVARPGDGQPCTPAGKCLFGDVCLAGTCHRQPALGQACVLTHDAKACFVGYCDPTTRVCTQYKAPGAACDATNFECSNDTRNCATAADGGTNCLDAFCRAQDGGAAACTTPCR